MNYHIKYLLSLILFISTNSYADLFEDLSKLKKICDADLLTKEECETRKKKILAEHDGKHDEWFCNYAGETGSPKLFSDDNSKSFSESSSASSIIKEILDEAGLAPNFIVRPANVPNASASARSGQRYIEYNPSFVSKLKQGTNSNWSVYSVMAHEIGHHLQGHTFQSGGSRPSIELEADEYSGFILAKLGATLPQAQIAMKTFGSNSSSGTHPKTDSRLKAIKAGWQKAKSSTSAETSKIAPEKSKKQPVSQQPQPPQRQIPPQPTVQYSDSCVINRESVVITTNGAVLSRNRGFMQVGQKVQSMDRRCIFDLQSQRGTYCIAQNGYVYFGSPNPVGRCQPCNNNMCN